MKELKKEAKKVLQLKKLAEEKEKAVKKLKKIAKDEEDIDLNLLATEEDEEEEQKPTEEEQELEQFLKNYNQSGGKVSVFRWNDELNDWAMIGTYSIKDFENSVEKVAKTYGGGTYKFIIRDSKGQFVKQFTQTFDEIAYPKKTIEQFYMPPEPTNNFNPVEMIKEMKDLAKEQQTNFMQMMTEFVKTMGMTLAQRKNLFDSTEDLVNLKKLFSEQKTNPYDTLENLVNVLKAGIELGSNLSNESEEKESIIESLVKKLFLSTPADKLVNALSSLEQKPKHTTEIKQAEMKQISELKPEVKQIENKEVKEMAQQNMLYTLARLNVKPDKIAKTFIDSADEFTLNLIINLKDDKEEIKKVLLDMLPELSKYPEWTDKFIEAIVNETNRIIEPEKNDN